MRINEITNLCLTFFKSAMQLIGITQVKENINWGISYNAWNKNVKSQTTKVKEKFKTFIYCSYISLYYCYIGSLIENTKL